MCESARARLIAKVEYPLVNRKVQCELRLCRFTLLVLNRETLCHIRLGSFLILMGVHLMQIPKTLND